MTDVSCVKQFDQILGLGIYDYSDQELKCMGVDQTLDQLKETWANEGGDISTSCNAIFNRLIYTGSPVPADVTLIGDSVERKYNKAGFQRAMDDMDYLMSSYFFKDTSETELGGHTIAVPGQPGYDVFQEVIVDACTNEEYQNQGICQNALSMMCKGCTRDEVPRNADLLKLCGCQTTPLDPTKYPGITPECDPLCAQGSVSKKRNVNTGAVAECNSAICVIDSVSIQAANSTVGGINFTQVCPQCSGGSCKCIVNTSVSTTAESVGIGDQYSFQQYCGQNSVCLVIDDTTEQETQVPCADAIKPIQPREYSYPVSVWVWFFAVVIVFIGLLALASTIYTNVHMRETNVDNRDSSTSRIN